MKINSKKGFIIILVIASLAILVLSASVIVTIGCGELMATRGRNDLVSAYYVAMSGCERMYAHQKTLASLSTSINGTISVGSDTIGTYGAAAYDYSYDKDEKAGEFYIVSTGTVNGRMATATVKIGYTADYSGPYTVGAYGKVTLTSGSTSAKIKMEGPVASAETVTVTPGGKVDISGDPDIIDDAEFSEVTFWPADRVGDANRDGTIYSDGDSSNSITSGEYVGQEADFALDDVYPPGSPDGVVNEKDAFYYYYTTYLNLHPQIP